MQVVQTDQMIGQKLGKYQVEHQLGRGQLSAVYLARQGSQEQAVLITVFHYPESLSMRERARLNSDFAQEGAALVRLRHAHILPTLDFGEQAGQLYLVTAFAKGASLSQLLKQQARLTPEQALHILRQLADGLDYAHRNGVTHGNLSLSNVLVGGEMSAQIAGFGLKTILESHHDRVSTAPQARLLSPNGAFLGNCDYVAPERVQGLSSGAPADIYALGVMLFELLTGTPPFHGATPLETALQRIQQPVPLLHATCPDISEGFDLVIGKALARDPALRYQKAGEVASSFERALKALEVAQSASFFVSSPATSPEQVVRASFDRQATILTDTGTNNEQDGTNSGNWQLKPPIVTGQIAAVAPTSFKQTEPHQEAVARQDRRIGDSIVGADPFAWWAATTSQAPQREPGTFTANTTPRSTVRLSNARRQRPVVRQDRRQAIKLITTGAVIAGVFAAGGISFDRFAQSLKQANQAATTTSPGSTTTTQGNTPTAGTTQTAHPTSTATKTASPKPSPTHGTRPTPTTQPTGQPTTQPTTQPTPQPTQPPPPPSPSPSPTPGHTGTVIGHTSQATNSAVKFTNPADGQDSLLIHLSNGNFVACERACTHAGVAVNYNSGQQQLVCPAHGAIFDPLNGFAHTSGPGNGPLSTVAIRVNGDGTITTG